MEKITKEILLCVFLFFSLLVLKIFFQGDFLFLFFSLKKDFKKIREKKRVF